MSQDLIQKISLLLGIGPESIVHGDVSGQDVYQARTARGIPYLVLAMATSSDATAEGVLKQVLLRLPTATTGVLLTTDLAISRALRKSPRTGDFDQIGFQVDCKRSNLGRLPLAWHQLRPLEGNVEHVLFEVHSALRDIDGLHAPEALDEICKLLYAKLYDEENTSKTMYPVFQRDGYSSADECAAEVRALYGAAVDAVEKVPTPEDRIQTRGVFKDGLLLSSAAIARSAELLQGVNLSSSSIDIKGRAFQNVLLPAMRSGMGQYFTPKEIIDFIIEVIAPCSKEKILDPFCGSGHFLSSSLDYVRKAEACVGAKLKRFAADKLHGIEKSDRMVRIAMTDMRLHGDGQTHIRCGDALLPFRAYSDIEPASFDVIVTNPPFGVDLTEEALRELGPFELGERRGSVSMEIVALERCVQLLRPGGRMAIVLPDGILSNKSTVHVRDWMKDKLEIRAIASLPSHAFTPFGASIKTSVVFARRRAGAADQVQRVVLCELDAIGYDSAGRQVGNNELLQVADQLKTALGCGGW